MASSPPPSAPSSLSPLVPTTSSSHDPDSDDDHYISSDDADEADEADDEADDADDLEIVLYTAPQPADGASSPGSPSPASAAPPMLCTSTLLSLQRAGCPDEVGCHRGGSGVRPATTSPDDDTVRTCLICLEALSPPPPARGRRCGRGGRGGPAASPPMLLVSHIPVRLVCNCTVTAHPACLSRWLQRTLACPICHCSAQFQPRPGQVVRPSHGAYQRLLDHEQSRHVNYMWEIRRRQCAHMAQCACALTTVGFIVWGMSVYSAWGQ